MALVERPWFVLCRNGVLDLEPSAAVMGNFSSERRASWAVMLRG